MIQRIQTIYLLFAVVLTAIACFSPVLLFEGNGLWQQLTFSGLMQVEGEGYVLVERNLFYSLYALIIPLISFVTIVLFKKRMVQIRLCVFNLILMIGYYVMLAVAVYGYTKRGMDWEVTYKASFHIISAVFTYLALRAIGKDEALVRSLNRLR